MRFGLIRRRRRRAIFVFMVLMLMAGVLLWQVQPRSLFGGRAVIAPTACPDTLACHALKRMQPKTGQ